MDTPPVELTTHPIFAYAIEHWWWFLIAFTLIGIIMAVAADASAEADAKGRVPKTHRAVWLAGKKHWSKLGSYATDNDVTIANIIFWLFCVAVMVASVGAVFAINLGNFALVMQGAAVGEVIPPFKMFGFFKFRDVAYIIALLSGVYVILDVLGPMSLHYFQNICEKHKSNKDSSAYKTGWFLFWFIFSVQVIMVVGEIILAGYRGYFIEGGDNALVSGLMMVIIAPATVVFSQVASYLVKRTIENGIALVWFVLLIPATLVIGLPALIMAVPMGLILSIGGSSDDSKNKGGE